jgi:predicted transposase YbfD/YdcC
MDELIEHFSALEDPRCPGKVSHPLLDILVVTVCAVIAGADGWEDVALYGRSKLTWLRQFLSLPHGIPSHDTFRRVFMLIDPEAFEACFLAWVSSLSEPVEREVMAIDGKTLRRSFDRRRGQSPLHLVSAWATEQSLALAQHAVESKSNEITAIPALLDALALENTLVTLDAMGAQKSIALQICERGADYLLVLKANQGKTYTTVREHFDEHCFRRGASGRPLFDAFDDSHGRTVRRRVFVSREPALLETLSDWPGLRTVLATESIRSLNGSTKVEAETRYFLSSDVGNPQRLAQAIRRHWSIENRLHWILDVTFGEDQSRVRDERAARNLALLRKIAINLLNGAQSGKGTLRAKRKKAAWNDTYMMQVLSNAFVR